MNRDVGRRGRGPGADAGALVALEEAELEEDVRAGVEELARDVADLRFAALGAWEGPVERERLGCAVAYARA